MLDYVVNRINPLWNDKLHPWKAFSLLLSLRCIPCDTFSVTFMLLFTSRIINVDPIMSVHLVYYELPLLSQFGIMACVWNQVLRRCEYRLVCGEGFLISWESLELLFPAVRVCTTTDDESICLCCTVPLWNGSWILESLSLHCLLCSCLEKLTGNWCSWSPLLYLSP